MQRNVEAAPPLPAPPPAAGWSLLTVGPGPLGLGPGLGHAPFVLQGTRPGFVADFYLALTGPIDEPPPPPEGQAAAQSAAAPGAPPTTSDEEKEGTGMASVKDEAIVPPMPADAVVKEEAVVPPMPSNARWSDATVKEENTVLTRPRPCRPVPS